MNIAIYARVSSDTQTKEGTIQSQLDTLREYAQAHNMTIIHECLDDGVSGANLNRPGLDQLRDLALEGIFQAVVILSPDRLSRKQSHLLILLDEFKKRNIQVMFTNQQFGDSPEDNLMLQIQGAISEYERTKILDRMRRGRKYSVKKGQVLGNKAPFGYKFICKSEGKPARWEVDPREAEIVKLIFDLYVNKGMKGTKIARHLESESFLSRSKTTRWWSSSIYRILKNETYLGTAYMFKHRRVEPTRKNPKAKKYRRDKNSAKEQRPREDWMGIPVMPLIDKKTWDAAQKLLKKNALQARRNNNKNKYLLRGLVVCGLCGCMASGYVSNKKTYYSCVAKRNKNITSKPHDENIAVRHKAFDEKVWTGLKELLSDPAEMQAQLEKRLERRNHQTPTKPNGFEKIDKELVQLAKQKGRILDAYREEVISLDELKEQRAKIEKRQEVLEAKKKAALSQQEGSRRSEITMDMLGDVSARFQRAMKNASFDKRQKLANLLINSVTLFSERAIVKGAIPLSGGDVLNLSNICQGSYRKQKRVTVGNNSNHHTKYWQGPIHNIPALHYRLNRHNCR